MRTVTIPAPCEWLSANERTHWGVKARRTAMWREAARVWARSVSLTPLAAPVTVTITVHRVSNRRADETNLAPTVKAVIDGITDAGWLRDDNDTQITATTCVAGTPLDRAALVLTFHEQGDEA